MGHYCSAVPKVQTPDTLSLIGGSNTKAFDAITRIASRLLKAPVSLISIVQDDLDRQYFVSAKGLQEPWRSQSCTPLSHSFCRHVRDQNRPLAVDDARTHPTFQNHPAIVDLNVTAYLGAPILGPDGTAWGALCVIDDTPRHWSDADTDVLCDVSQCVTDEILLRAALLEAEDLHIQAKRYQAKQESLFQAFVSPGADSVARLENLLGAACQALGMESATMARLCCGDLEPIASFGTRPAVRCEIDGKIAAEITDRLLIHMSPVLHRQTICGQSPGAYIAAPIILENALFGVVEFFRKEPMTDREWSRDDASIVTTTAMLICAHIDMIGQVRHLKTSEMFLMQELMDLRRKSVGALT